MFPVSGGTARFPHFAFGSVAGIGFGFFSYMQAVTIAPIECFAFMQYASYYWPSIYDSTTKNVTGIGFILTVILMAIFVAVNFLAMRIFARVNNVITWWKVAVPVLAIIVLLTHWHTGNFTAGGTGFMPGGIKALFGALPAAGIIFAYSGFEQCDQLAGEIKNPGRNLPRAIVISVLIGTAIYCLLQVAFIVALPPAMLGSHGGLIGLSCPETGTCNPSIAELNAGPFAAVAVFAGLGWLAHILRIDAFVSPSGTGLIYTTGTSRISYGLARNRYAPQIFGRVRQERHPVGRADRRVPDRAALPAAVPELALAGRPDHRSERADVRGRAAVPGRVPPSATRRHRPYRMQAAWFLAPAAFVVSDLLIYWSGFEVIWKLGIVLVIGYVLIGIWMAFDPQRPPLDWKSAVWLPAWLIGMGIISWQGQYSGAASSDKHRSADQHRPHRVLVGHADRGRVQRGHLLLGDVHQAAARRDAAAGQPAGRRAGTSRPLPVTELARDRERPRRPAGPFSCAGAYTRPVRE